MAQAKEFKKRSEKGHPGATVTVDRSDVLYIEMEYYTPLGSGAYLSGAKLILRGGVELPVDLSYEDAVLWYAQSSPGFKRERVPRHLTDHIFPAGEDEEDY